ncbi:MAG: alpha/beta hydrolase, partial [Myxococcota bacterium]
MRETPLELETEDRVVLHGLIWEPDGAPTAMVQILHGMGEHIGRYARLATELCELGYVVLGHDQRGHGRTIREPQDQGHFADDDGWSKVVSDARAVTNEARERFGDLPIVVFGHSMGSYILQAYLFQYDDVAGAVLSGSTLNAGLLVKIGRPAAKFER